MSGALRLDKWLWFARFAKSRADAQKLIERGQVSLNGKVVEKVSANVKVGDALAIVTGPTRHSIDVVALGARRGILPAFRYETAIDDDDAAAGEPQRRHHPIAGSRHVAAERRAIGVDQRLLVREELAAERDPPEFLVGRIEFVPALARWNIGRERGETRREHIDQPFFPGLALKLPEAEAKQRDKNRECEQAAHREPEPRSACWRGARGHGSASPASRPSAAL